MRERLSAPAPVPRDEWTKAEQERGETFPQHITPLAARVKTPEQHEINKLLEERCEKLEKELFERWSEPWNLSREQHNEILYRYEAELTNIAAFARNLADSYRHFDVGAVAIGYQDPRIFDEAAGLPRYASDKKTNPWRLLFDANTRPETIENIVLSHGNDVEEKQSTVRKYCAELYITDRIDPSKPECGLPREKLTKTLAIFIVGEAQTDNDSLIRQCTLTSCKLCRDRLWKKTLTEDEKGDPQKPIFDQDMPVISADARNLNNRKWQPIIRLHEFHKERRPRNPNDFYLD